MWTKHQPIGTLHLVPFERIHRAGPPPKQLARLSRWLFHRLHSQRCMEANIFCRWNATFHDSVLDTTCQLLAYLLLLLLTKPLTLAWTSKHMSAAMDQQDFSIPEDDLDRMRPLLWTSVICSAFSNINILLLPSVPRRARMGVGMIVVLLTFSASVAHLRSFWRSSVDRRMVEHDRSFSNQIMRLLATKAYERDEDNYFGKNRMSQHEVEMGQLKSLRTRVKNNRERHRTGIKLWRYTNIGSTRLHVVYGLYSLNGGETSCCGGHLYVAWILWFHVSHMYIWSDSYSNVVSGARRM